MSVYIMGTMSKPSILPTWIKLWLIVSSVICAIDVSFTMLRPATLRGHEFGRIYFLWNIYADVDIRYAQPNDIVTGTTGRLMIFEILLNVLALALNARNSNHTLVTAFFTNILVFWKTVIYMALYVKVPIGNPSYFTPGLPSWQIFLCFWFMNGLWVFIPLLAIIRLWIDLVNVKKEIKYVSSLAV